MSEVPFWTEAVVAALLVSSGVFVVIGEPYQGPRPALLAGRLANARRDPGGATR